MRVDVPMTPVSVEPKPSTVITFGEQRGQLGLRRRREHRPARREHEERRHVVARGSRRERVEQRSGHRIAHDRQDVHPFGRDQPPDLMRVEAAGRGKHDRAAAVSIENAPHCALDVHQRRQEQHHRADRQYSFRRSASGRGIGPCIVVGSPPPIAAKKMSSWRHTTPLGMPGRSARVRDVEVVARTSARSRARADSAASARSYSTILRPPRPSRCRRRRRTVRASGPGRATGAIRRVPTSGGRRARRDRRRRRGTRAPTRRTGSSRSPAPHGA